MPGGRTVKPCASLNVLDLHLAVLGDALTNGWLQPEEACAVISLWTMQVVFGRVDWRVI